MENTEKLHRHIAGAYSAWVAYAARYIRRSKLPIDPAEVVNDILCTLLERDVQKLTELADNAKGRGDLDFFMMKIIKTSIYSPRSPFRYQRGQHCTRRLTERIQFTDEQTDVNRDEIHKAVWDALAELKLPELARKVFVWKFFDDNPIATWPGTETKRMLYRAYNRAMDEVILCVRKKMA